MVYFYNLLHCANRVVHRRQNPFDLENEAHRRFQHSGGQVREIGNSRHAKRGKRAAAGASTYVAAEQDAGSTAPALGVPFSRF